MEPGSEHVTVREGLSYGVLRYARSIALCEIECTVPVDVGSACVKQILETISAIKLPVNIPIEYRHVKRDDKC